MIGIYGGTFDPIHLGHLGLATAVSEHLSLTHIYFVPLGMAVHRDQPQTGEAQRLRMLQTALNSYSQYHVDTTELDRAGPSWTIQTLQDFRTRFPEDTLCLLMGSDAFRHIDSWRDWSSLLDFAHIVVVARKGDTAQLSGVVANYLLENQLNTLEDGNFDGNQPQRHGILWLEADVPGVSSTQIRTFIQQRNHLDGLVLPSVARIIKEEQLYGG